MTKIYRTNKFIPLFKLLLNLIVLPLIQRLECVINNYIKVVDSTRPNSLNFINYIINSDLQFYLDYYLINK